MLSNCEMWKSTYTEENYLELNKYIGGEAVFIIYVTEFAVLVE